MKDLNVGKIISPEYENTKLNLTWGERQYDKYYEGEKTWLWQYYPDFSPRKNIFSPCFVPDGKSVLEVGCAAGGAYRFLKNNKAISDTTDFTGLDISDKGISNCKKLHPKATWIQADLTKHNFDRKYDFVYERIAVHHMPDPLTIINKLASITSESIALTFVSSLNGSTVSDLAKARYRHDKGELVYFDLINPLEVSEILLNQGFNEFQFFYYGKHEAIDSNPLCHQYISPEINIEKRMLGRITIVATKSNSKSLKITNHRFTGSKILTPLKLIKSYCNGRAKHMNVLDHHLKGFGVRRSDSVLPTSRYGD